MPSVDRWKGPAECPFGEASLLACRIQGWRFCGVTAETPIGNCDRKVPGFPESTVLCLNA